MRNRLSKGLVSLIISGIMFGNVAGCMEGGDSPPSNLEEAKKVKTESLKGFVKPPKKGKTKKALTPEDTF